jgi:hypothetical protein
MGVSAYRRVLGTAGNVSYSDGARRKAGVGLLRIPAWPRSSTTPRLRVLPCAEDSRNKFGSDLRSAVDDAALIEGPVAAEWYLQRSTAT